MKKSRILRFIFIKETFILIFALVWVWFTIGLFVDSSYSVNNLEAHSGVVIRLDSLITRVKNKPLYKEIDQELRLELNSASIIFTLTTTKNFGFISSRISEGDTVTVYTKPKLWGVFGLKKGSEINHLKKGDQVIVNYKDYKNSISGLSYLTLLFAVILMIVYIVKLRKRIIWD